MARTKEADKQARLALRNFRNLQPTLNAYARMLTGKPGVRVEAAAQSNGATDGKTIYYRPPISLGKVISHQRWKCDRRDELGLPRCPACLQREDVLTTIYHEIAHIWFESFPGLKEKDKERTIREAVKSLGTVYGEAVRKKIEHNKTEMGYMGLARLVSPFLPLLLNALEDARVNRALFDALPGTKVMFDANTAKIFRDGVEQEGADGEWEHQLWRDRPLNLQAIIGVFCMASGYNFDLWLHEFVVESLRDEKLVDLVSQLDDISDLSSTFNLAFPILARLRELGYCRDNDEDPEDDFVPPFCEPGEGDSGEGSEDDDDDSDDDHSDDNDSDDAEADAGGGDDPESKDDGSDGGESGSGDDRNESPQEDGDVVNEDTPEDGGDSPDGSADGHEEDDPGAGDDAGSDSPGAGDSDGVDEGEAAEEVSEKDSHSGDSDASGDADVPDSADFRDGEASGREGLDGSDGEDSGDEDAVESGHRGDDLSEPVGDDSEGRSSDSGVESCDTDGDAEFDGEPEPLDMAAGGQSVRVEGEYTKPERPDIKWGDASEIEITVHQLGEHDAPGSVKMPDHDEAHEKGIPHTHRTDEDKDGDEAVKVALISGLYFEMPSANVTNVRFFDGDFIEEKYNKILDDDRIYYGVDGDFAAPEAIVAPALLHARTVFADNKRAHRQPGLKRGRIHGPSLARRAPAGDDRMFTQRMLPGQTDYFVGIGIDISGSTVGTNITLAKQVAMAEAELLSRLGIPFFVYGHSGDGEWNDDLGGHELSLDMYEIKTADTPWNDVTRERLAKLGPQCVNLDGHTIQFYRKMLEKQRATKKILHYYSDGNMPCENFDEELAILRSEIVAYKKAGIVLAGVGIRTDAPKQHGLPTVEVNEQSDVILVVKDLERRLTER